MIPQSWEDGPGFVLVVRMISQPYLYQNIVHAKNVEGLKQCGANRHTISNRFQVRSQSNACSTVLNPFCFLSIVGALAMSAVNDDVLLSAKHGLYPPALEPKHGCYDRMCTMDKETYTRLSYNTNNGEETKWI